MVFPNGVSYTEGHYLKDPINFYATAFYLPSYISANETTSSNIVSVSLDYYGKTHSNPYNIPLTKYVGCTDATNPLQQLFAARDLLRQPNIFC